MEDFHTLGNKIRRFRLFLDQRLKHLRGLLSTTYESDRKKIFATFMLYIQ